MTGGTPAAGDRPEGSAAEPDQTGGEPDLTGGDRYAAWSGTYRARRAFAPRYPRVWAVLLVAYGAFVADRSAEQVAQDGWLGVLTVVFSPLTAVAALLVLRARRPLMTRVCAEGLTSRTTPLKTLTAPWSRVVRGQPPGRFDLHAVAVLVDGTRMPLPALPTEVAAAMTAAGDPPSDGAPRKERSATPAAGGARLGLPVPGEDLDGPFRRG